MVKVIKSGASKANIKTAMSQIYSKVSSKAFDAKKHFGKIKLKEDPLEIQKRLRDEW